MIYLLTSLLASRLIPWFKVKQNKTNFCGLKWQHLCLSVSKIFFKLSYPPKKKKNLVDSTWYCKMKKNTAYIFYGPGFSYPALTWMPTVVLSSVRRQPGALLITECVKLSPLRATHSCFFPINLHQCHSLFLEQKMSYCTKVQRKQWENSCPSRNVFKNSFPPKKKKKKLKNQAK